MRKVSFKLAFLRLPTARPVMRSTNCEISLPKISSPAVVIIVCELMGYRTGECHHDQFQNPVGSLLRKVHIPVLLPRIDRDQLD